MTWVAVAIGGSAVLGAGASLAGANKQSKAGKKAAKMQQEQNVQQRGDQMSFMQAGYAANDQLRTLLGLGDNKDAAGFGSLVKPFDAEEFKRFQDPGYQFRRQQGEQSLLNSASAGSGAMSGAALKDLLSFNQDLASTEYGNAFNRYQTQQGNIFQRLAGLTQTGQAAASNQAAQGTALSQGAGQAIQNAGTAAGAGIVGAGNALSQGASNYWLTQMIKPPVAQPGGP